MRIKDIEQIIREFRRQSDFQEGIAVCRTSESVSAEFSSFNEKLSPEAIRVFQGIGISQLYRHQEEAIEQILNGENLVISTGTASGKSLCYLLPVVNSLIQSSKSCSLFLYPTKALCHDQKNQINQIINEMDKLYQICPDFGVYDGDTVRDERKRIRDSAQVVLSNPDMFHIGILPNHTEWSRFFSNLRYVVIDEVHIYRGIFGSHFCNLLRRLKRICRFYGSHPQFILCSATLSNIEEFSEKLTEESVKLVDNDYSQKGKRNFIIYNPPFLNKELGIRHSYIKETVKILRFFREFDIQILLFARSRRVVEMIYANLERNDDFTDDVRTYRSGYLASKRRETESEMKSGNIKTVIATNALELGIDIGGVDIVILCGYPGSIAATRQQSGRAGRRNKSSLTVMVSSSEPLEQYIVNHPEYIFDKSPEQALIEPDNPYILLSHLSSAVYELPFKRDENFGSLDKQQSDFFLNLLQKMNKTRLSRDKYFWISEKYPAEEISLRAADPNQFALICENQIIGKLDRDSALWMTHPGAVYLQEGIIYLVENLDLEHGIVNLSIKDPGYYTEHMTKVDIELIELEKQDEIKDYCKYFGKLKVTTIITGFRKIHWSSHEILDYGMLDLPPSVLITKGYWFSLSPESVIKLKEDNHWFSEQNNYGKEWNQIREKVLIRDENRCQGCGESKSKLEIHHKIPFKKFNNTQSANDLSNLVTLCSSCHKEAEAMVKVQSALNGMEYLLHNLAPIFIMSDKTDLGAHKEACAVYADQNPSLLFYDKAAGGIGLSEKLYDLHTEMLKSGLNTLRACECTEGCPSCSGAVTENGWGAKEMVEIILQGLTDEQ